MTAASAPERAGPSHVSPGITVAGRTFRPVTSRSDGKYVFDQYQWITSAIWAVQLGEAETMREVMAAVARSGQGPMLLAGLVVEEVEGQPTRWTVDAAREWLAFFSGPHTIGDCLVIQAAIQRALPDFFPGARDSSETSGSVSESVETPASISATPPSDGTPLASSAASSAPSPAGTPTSSPA